MFLLFLVVVFVCLFVVVFRLFFFFCCLRKFFRPQLKNEIDTTPEISLTEKNISL